MRGFLAGLLVASLILVVALLAATIGALGVAAIGLLLHHLFDLTQWQGTVIAFGVAMGLGFLVYKMAAQPDLPTTWDEDWDDGEDEDEDEDDYESPIVPWRRSRPTPGELPGDKAGRSGKPTGKPGGPK